MPWGLLAASGAANDSLLVEVFSPVDLQNIIFFGHASYLILYCSISFAGSSLFSTSFMSSVNTLALNGFNIILSWWFLNLSLSWHHLWDPESLLYISIQIWISSNLIALSRTQNPLSVQRHKSSNKYLTLVNRFFSTGTWITNSETILCISQDKTNGLIYWKLWEPSFSLMGDVTNTAMEKSRL